jgi:hypothetical protein
MLYEMRTWRDQLPSSLPPAVREIFEFELLYSYVYCLGSSCRNPEVSELGKILIFEYAMDYINRLSNVVADQTHNGFYTYHDALRCFFMGSQFIAVLSQGMDNLLHQQGTIPPYQNFPSRGPPPPPIPNYGRTDNVERSLACIDKVVRILGIYGERWEDSTQLRRTFEAHAKNVKMQLEGRLGRTQGLPLSI